jgi:ACS family hexuronate transporter-like MFS transporter
MGSGWLVDRIGARAGLALFTLVWSAVTVGCGLATSFWLLLVFRALLGLAEPGFHPVTMRAGTALSPESGRGVFFTLASLGGNVATVVAVPIITMIVVHLHWRVAFIAPGLLGLLVSLVWWRTYRDLPAGHVSGAKAEAVEPAFNWARLWRQRCLWGVLLVRLVIDPVWYFCMFWMPGYLLEVKHLTMAQLALVGWIPFMTGNAGTLVFVAFSDRCGVRHGLKGRKRLVCATALFAPLCVLIPYTDSIMVTIVLFSLIAIICNSWMGSLAPIIAEVFPYGNVASVFGIAGAFGAAGAIVMNHFVGNVAPRLNPMVMFIIMGCMHPIAVFILHFLVRPPSRHPVDLDRRPAHVA